MMIRTLLLSSLLTLSFTACGKKTDSSGGAAKTEEAKAGGAPKAAEAPKAAAKVWKKIPSMGIEVEVGADADVQDGTASAGFPSATIYSMDGSAATTFIFGAKDLNDSMFVSKDLDSTKARLQKETSGFKAFTKEDKTADGFRVEYTGTGMANPSSTTYGITIRSKVGDMTLDCSTNAETEATRAGTEAICKSIRAAK